MQCTIERLVNIQFKKRKLNDKMDNNINKLSCEPLKQIMLDLEALKQTIQQLDCDFPLDSLTPSKSEAEMVNTNELEVSSVNTNSNESILEGERNNPQWLNTIGEIYNTLVATVTFLQTNMEEVRFKFIQKNNSGTEPFASDKVIEPEQNIPKAMMHQIISIENPIDSQENPKTRSKEDVSQTIQKDIIDEACDVNTVHEEISGIIPTYIGFIHHTNELNSSKHFHDEKIKLSFEKAILYHKEYMNLLQQCKYIEVKIKTTNKLLKYLNSEMSKKIQELTESLSNVSQQNTKIHFAAVFALNHVNNVQERITELRKKKACLAKMLHEKEVYLKNITSDGIQLSYCLNSFLEFEKMVQQHFQKKNTSITQDHNQLFSILSTRRDELNQIESMISDNYNSVIPSVKKEIANWKNAYQEATKEIEDFNKNLYLLKKKKEQLIHEDSIIKQDLETTRNHIVLQKEVLKIKKKKQKKTKRELERKYKEVKARLQRIIHAIVLDDMCFMRLKMSDNEDTFKSELKMLLTGHNECRTRKQHTTMLAEQMKDSIKIIYGELMCLKEMSQICSSYISCELTTTKTKYSTHEQGISFLQQKKQILKEGNITLQKDILEIQQSKEYSALIILIIQNKIKNMTLKINIWTKEKKECMEMLGFRGPLASPDVEKEAKEGMCTLQRFDINKVMISQISYLFIYIYYYFILLLILLVTFFPICRMCHEPETDLSRLYFIKCNNVRSIKVT